MCLLNQKGVNFDGIQINFSVVAHGLLMSSPRNLCLIQRHDLLSLMLTGHTCGSLISFELTFLSALLSVLKCCDLGYHASLNRALRTYLSAEYNLETSRHEGLDIIENAVDNLEPRSDKQRFMEMYPAAFCPPMKFEFQSHMGDEVSD